MGGVRTAIRIDSIIGIAVIGSKQNHVIVCKSASYNGLYTSVYASYGIADCIVHSGMADHVAVGKVEDDHILLFTSDSLAELARNLNRTHLRLQVVGGNLRRVYKDTVLKFKRSLASAVEEEGHVSVFFGLGDAELTLARLGNGLAEGVADFFLVEENVQSLE